jgi:hypothetical protein
LAFSIWEDIRFDVSQALFYRLVRGRAQGYTSISCKQLKPRKRPFTYVDVDPLWTLDFSAFFNQLLKSCYNFPKPFRLFGL